MADPEPGSPVRSPWRTYRACLEQLEPDATHLLIVQDDAQVCRDFPAALEQVLQARPGAPLALFVPGVGLMARLVLDACAAGRRYCDLNPREWVPVVATVWPRAHAEAFLEFGIRRGAQAVRTADDGLAGDFCRERRVTVAATVPSLINHPDDRISLVGRAHFGGANPARTAACWVGETMSPLELDWSG